MLASNVRVKSIWTHSGGGASCTTRLFEGEGFDSIPSKILAPWQLATCPSAPYPRLLAPGPSYFRRPYIAKKNLLSFPLLLSICLNLLCSRLMNPSSRQETHWNIFKRFFLLFIVAKKMLVIVTSRQTFGLIFKFWSHLPQNSEFFKKFSVQKNRWPHNYSRILFRTEMNWTNPRLMNKICLNIKRS